MLIADDNRDAADTLALCLQLDGHAVIVAYDGLSAVELATREQPPVLLLDIGMPGLNGYEVARRIRQQDWGRQARLVALTGGGVDWSAYGPDMIESQGDFNRPWLVNSFGSTMLPAIPAIHERLSADPRARVADVACGVGWAAISIARAYPTIAVDGFDLDPSSIALANENARAAGVDDRVTFAVRDAADPAAVGQYDLVVIVEAVHDLSRPVEVLTAVRRMLRPGGSVLIADERTEDAFTAPAGDLERLYYGFSILTCLPAAMTERPTAATGTAMRPSTLQRYAAEAGFGGFEGLDEPATDTLRFYRLTM